MGKRPVVIAAASRPYRGESVNGDGWTVSWHDGTCRLAVIDGLGHGPDAAAATRVAIDTLAAHPHLPPAEALRACHQALQGTRGAAMSIAWIDPIALQLTYAGVGNVEARLWQPGGWRRPISYRGIVGAVLPIIHSFDFHLESAWLLLLHTDGVSARFDGDLPRHDARRKPQAFAEAVISEWGRDTDDATIVVASPPPNGRRHATAPDARAAPQPITVRRREQPGR